MNAKQRQILSTLPKWSRGFVDDNLLQRSRPPLVHDTAVSPKPIDVKEVFSREELFYIAYVPFVIGELVWDYADTVTLLAAELKIDATKPLCRLIKKASKEYHREQRECLKRDYSEMELNNAYVYEDGVAHIVNQFMVNLHHDLKREYPELGSGWVNLITAVYQCWLTYRALKSFMGKQRDKVYNRTGMNMSFILPKQFFILERLVPAFLGDKPASERFAKLMGQYVATLANQIALVDMEEMRGAKELI